jgi:GNAT superfamily N-acetyltransferase
MFLQTVDDFYWPEAAPGAALYIHKLAVRRAFAGQGLLGEMLAFAAADARARGIPLLRLDTFLRPAMQLMYERHGFSVVAETPRTVRGRQIIRLERAI